VERRLLAAAALTPDTAAPDPAAPPASPQVSRQVSLWPLAVALGMILTSGAGLVYLEQGAPWYERLQGFTHDAGNVSQFADLIAELELRLKDNPEDRRGWVLLARGYARQNRLSEAMTAQQRAVALATTDSEAAETAAGFGQVLVEEANGLVTPEARQAFAEATRRDPTQQQARYFLGLAKLQDGNEQAAIDDWRALLADTPSDAPWRDGLERQVAQIEAARNAPASPEDRQAMIESMVARLATRLDAVRESGGGTAEEWTQLGRSYRVLARPTEARDAYAEAVKRAPDNLDLLRDYVATVGDADGKASPAYAAVLQRLRDRLPPGSEERLAIEERLKNL